MMYLYDVTSMQQDGIPWNRFNDFLCLLIKPTNKRLHPTYRPLKQKLKLKVSSDKHI